MKARKRIEAVITGTIGNRVVFTGSGVRIPSLPPDMNNTNTETNSGFVLFFLTIISASELNIKYGAISR